MRNINPDSIYNATDPFYRYFSLADLNLVWATSSVNIRTSRDFIGGIRFLVSDD